MQHPNSVADCNSVLDEVLSNLSAILTETSTNLESWCITEHSGGENAGLSALFKI